MIIITVDNIYQNFLEEVKKEDDSCLYSKIGSLLCKLKCYCLENRNRELLSLIFTLERSYNSSIRYIEEKPRTMATAYLPVAFYEQPAIKKAIFIMEEEDYSIIDKLEILIGMLAFSSRIENVVSSYERKKLASYTVDQYIIFGEVLRKITDPYHDWIVPIFTSDRVQQRIRKTSKEDSINYLMKVFNQFYNVFFPNDEQDKNTFDLFSYIDLYTEDNLDYQIPSNYMRQIYSKLDEVEDKGFTKKKVYS